MLLGQTRGQRLRGRVRTSYGMSLILFLRVTGMSSDSTNILTFC